MITELPQDWGNTLGGHKQSLVHTRSQKKGAETESDLPVSVQESLVEVWVDGGLPRVRGTNYNSPGISPLEERSPLAPLSLS